MNKTKLLFLLIIQFVFSQNDNVHALNVGAFNQVTIVSYHYEHFVNAKYRLSIGYSPFYGTFGEPKWNFEDDAILISAHYLLGKNKNFSVGLGSSQKYNFSNMEFHLITGYTAWISDLYFRSSINIILNDNFYNTGKGEMGLGGIYFLSFNLGYAF